MNRTFCFVPVRKGVEVFLVRTCVCWGINLWYVGLSILSLLPA